MTTKRRVPLPTKRRCPKCGRGRVAPNEDGQLACHLCGWRETVISAPEGDEHRHLSNGDTRVVTVYYAASRFSLSPNGRVPLRVTVTGAKGHLAWRVQAILVPLPPPPTRDRQEMCNELFPQLVRALTDLVGMPVVEIRRTIVECGG